MSVASDRDFEDLQRRRDAHRRWHYGRQPKQINNVIAQVMQKRGYAQVRAAGERDQAWRSVAGEELQSNTQIGELRRGVFEVLVANSLLMQELTFRKEDLLAGLQEALPESHIKQLRFRLAQINQAST